ncbi:MAG: DUF6485 family protein [Candidatus Thorarchaeota archaeon]
MRIFQIFKTYLIYECIGYHLSMNQLHDCAFIKISKQAEKSYNRDFEYFAELVLDR